MKKSPSARAWTASPRMESLEERLLLSAWNNLGTLVAAGASSTGAYGSALAVDGDYAVVGAFNTDTSAGSKAGAAYVFHRSGGAWSLMATLAPSDAQANDDFGTSVAIKGTTIVVGASQFSEMLGDGATSYGKAYVFQLNGANWVQQAELTGTPGQANQSAQLFGYSVATNGSYIVVGSPGDDFDTNLPDDPEQRTLNGGSAYVYQLNGANWTQVADLYSSDEAAWDGFGYTVVMDGNTILSSAVTATVGNNSQQGAVYAFTGSDANWTQQAKLVNSTGGANCFTGWSLALSGDTALVGSYVGDVATIFQRSGATWTQVTNLVSGSDYAYAFGLTVALAGNNTAFIGAPYSDTPVGGMSAGQVYMFTASGSTWTNQGPFAADGVTESSLFGNALAADSDTLLILSGMNDGSAQTSVYAYTTAPKPNTAPVLDNTAAMTLTSIAEDATSNSGMLITDLLASAGGNRITDPDVPALHGIGIVGTDNANGTWQFTIDGGSHWASFKGYYSTTRLLAADANTRIRFVPNANYNGTVSDAITFRAWDQTTGTNGGTTNGLVAGGTSSLSVNKEVSAITVTPVNDAPVLDISGTFRLDPVMTGNTSNPGTKISDLIASAGGDRITDVDAYPVEGIAVVTTDTTNGTWQYTINGGTTWTTFKGYSTAAKLLASDASTRIRFVPNAGYAGTVANGITFRAWDRTSGVNGGTGNTLTRGGTSAFSAGLAAASVYAGPNHAPVLDSRGTMSLNPVAYNATNNSGTLVSDIIASAGGDRITDADSGAKEGIAVVAVYNTNGKWQYSLNNGTTWTDFGKAYYSSARLLASDATTRIRFVPNANWSGTLATGLVFRAWDQTQGVNGGVLSTNTNGGSSAFSTVQELIGVTVNAPVGGNAPAASSLAAPMLSAAAPAVTLGGTSTDPYVSYTQVDLGGGLYGYTVQLNDPTSGSSSWAANLTFSGYNGSAVQEKLYNGDTVLLQANANADDGKGGYTKSLDSWVYTNFSPILDGITEGTGTFTAHVGSTPGLGLGTTDFAYIVANGDISWTGTVSRAGTTYNQSGHSTVAPNHAPVLNTGGSPVLPTIDEDCGTGSSNPGGLISDLLSGNVSDADSSNSKGIAITATNSTNGTWQYTINGGSTWTSIGSASNTSALLLASNANTRVRFVPSHNFNGELTNGITFRAWDQTTGTAGTKVDVSTNGGTTAFSTATLPVIILINAVNDAPVLDNSVSFLMPNLQENDFNNTGITVKGLIASIGGDRITDVDANAAEGLAIISADNSNGAWQYSANGTTWTGMGAVSTTSARLLPANDVARIRFVPKSGFGGQLVGALRFRAWDQSANVIFGTGNTSSNGNTSSFSGAIGSADLLIQVQNNAPVLNTSGTMSFTTVRSDQPNNSGNLISDVIASAGIDGITDTDINHQEGIAVTGLNSALGTWQYSTDNRATWKTFGSVSATNALLLADTDYIRLSPNAGAGGTLANAITFRAWDRTTGTDGGTADASVNGGTTAFSSAFRCAQITVQAINRAPTLSTSTLMKLPSVAENATNNSGIKIADLIASAGDPVTDPDYKAGEGIAVVGCDTTHGTWQYSTNGGSTWTTFKAYYATSRLLAADADTYLRFVPDGAYTGTVANALTFRAWDQTEGTNGGVLSTLTTLPSSSVSSAKEAIGVTITPANHAPVLDNTGTMTLTPGLAGTKVSDFIASAGGDRITDVDAGAVEGIAVVATDSTIGAWQYSLNGTTWTTFKGYYTAAKLLSADAYIRFVPTPGYSGSITNALVFRAWDQTEGVNGGTLTAMVNGGTTSMSTALERINIAVAPNSAPVLDNTGNMTLTAGSAGTKVSDLIASAGGNRITDADAGAVEGIAVVATDTTHGTWQFSLNGTTWTTFKGYYTGATLLSADAYIRFVPAAGYTGTIASAITFRAWDQTQGANGGTMTTMPNGGTTAFSTATETASITV